MYNRTLPHCPTLYNDPFYVFRSRTPQYSEQFFLSIKEQVALCAHRSAKHFRPCLIKNCSESFLEHGKNNKSLSQSSGVFIPFPAGGNQLFPDPQPPPPPAAVLSPSQRAAQWAEDGSYLSTSSILLSPF